MFRVSATGIGSAALFVLAFAGAGWLHAQGAPPAAAADSAPETCIDEMARTPSNILSALSDCAFDRGTGPGARRDALLGLANWDHTLIGAFEFGARLFRSSEEAVIPVRVDSASASRKNAIRFSTSGSHLTLTSLTEAVRLNQLTRSGMNLAMNSAYGSFRLTYREIFTGRPNSLGGGVGQASAAAMYTTPRFGSKGLIDFSAGALMGTGSVNTLMGGGFGNSLIGGNGPGRKSQDAPTVAFKLTF
jgi:hypothetical protein